MTQVSGSSDYWTLKEKLLQIWLPTVVVRKFNDVLAKNSLKYIHHNLTLAMGLVEKDFTKEIFDVIC